MVQIIKEHIEKQLDFNKGKNLFYEKADQSFCFIESENELTKYLSEITKTDEEQLLDYVTNRSLEEFYRTNQYYSFDKSSKKQLRNIYSVLLNSLKKNNNQGDLSIRHFSRLRDWLQESNPFSEKIYSKTSSIAKYVACEEYSPELQISLLGINIQELVEPVLDIGCGKQTRLVSYLRKKGIDAYGIDRLDSKNPYCKQSDWQDYDFGIQKWGSIISNLGFSNHFLHHHLRSDGRYILYAKKYMTILNSLKVGGSFFYAPDLPFIECFLDSKYSVEKNEISKTFFNSTTITRK